MDDLARELAISKKTIYQYFESKADLIDFVLNSHLKSERDFCYSYAEQGLNSIDEMFVITKHVIEQLRKISPSALYDLQKYYPSSWKAFYSFHFEFIQTIIIDNISRGVKEGVYREDLNEELIAKLYAEITWKIVDEMSFPPSQFSREELFQNFVFYHMHGIVSENGKALLQKFKELIEV